MTKGPKRDETPTSIDWTRVGKEITQNRVGTETREKLVGFMKNTLSDLMTKILEIMAVYISDLENIFPRILKTLEENSVVDSDDLNQVMSDSIGRTMMVFALNKLNIASVGKPAVKDEPGQSYQVRLKKWIDFWYFTDVFCIFLAKSTVEHRRQCCSCKQIDEGDHKNKRRNKK